MSPTGARRTRFQTVGRLLAVEVVLVSAIIAIWSGCSVNKRNYKVLNFFFDGVPDPSLPAGSEPGVDGGPPRLVVVHRPFAEENCEACHRTRYRPSRNDSSICLECHDTVKTAHPFMHGPVEANACLWCHNPHESSHPALLRDTDRKVCSQCHTPSMLSSTKVPAHADTARGCLECHSGHGGLTSQMLKPGAPDGLMPTPAGPSPGKD
jgi:predicted CXXCH cytochrome family protein